MDAQLTGVMYRWDGVSWNEVDPPVTRPLSAVWVLSSQDGWAVGGEGTMLQLTPIETQVSTLLLVGAIVFCVAIGIVIYYSRKKPVSKEEAPRSQEGSTQGVGFGKSSNQGRESATPPAGEGSGGGNEHQNSGG